MVVDDIEETNDCPDPLRTNARLTFRNEMRQVALDAVYWRREDIGFKEVKQEIKKSILNNPLPTETIIGRNVKLIKIENSHLCEADRVLQAEKEFREWKDKLKLQLELRKLGFQI